jgi:hypothetical protein
MSRATMKCMGSGSEETQAVLPASEPSAGDEVDWWHRDHPVFVPLMAFYSGLVGLTLLPALYVGVLRSMMEFEQAERWFWVVGLVVLVPVGMLIGRHTRRAGAFALLGMLTAVVVVGGVGGLVLWFLLH